MAQSVCCLTKAFVRPQTLARWCRGLILIRGRGAGNELNALRLKVLILLLQPKFFLAGGLGCFGQGGGVKESYSFVTRDEKKHEFDVPSISFTLKINTMPQTLAILVHSCNYCKRARFMTVNISCIFLWFHFSRVANSNCRNIRTDPWSIQHLPHPSQV